MICKDNFTSRKKKLTEILNAHGIGYQTTPEETSFITAFFRQFHQDWAEKTRGMDVVTYIITEVHSHCKNGRCFFYKLENGFCCDIGFGSLTAKPKNPAKYARSNVAAACRHAIVYTCIRPITKKVEKMFKEGKTVRSEYSNKPIDRIEDVQIDHYDLSFQDLVSKWINIKGLDYLYSKVNMDDHSGTVTKFLDENLNKEFVKFHDKNTHLRVVSIKENLSELKK